MKTWGSWEKLRKCVYVCGVLFGLLLFTALHAPGKRVPQNEAKQTPTAEKATPRVTPAADKLKWNHAYGQLPLSFEENQGQTASEVRYVSHGSGYELFLTPDDVVLALRPKKIHDLSPLHRTATIRALRAGRKANPAPALRFHLMEQIVSSKSPAWANSPAG